jgi:hypothetical protein
MSGVILHRSQEISEEECSLQFRVSTTQQKLCLMYPVQKEKETFQIKLVQQ